MKDQTQPEMTVQDYENNGKYLGMYSFHDDESELYDTPFFCQSDLFARRHFIVTSKKAGTMFSEFRDHFTLVRLGFLDVTTGKFIPMDETIFLGEEVSNAISNES